MNTRVRLRLAALVAGFALMGLVIALLAVKSRRQMEQLRVRLNQVDSESMSIANEFSEHLRELNDLLYHYGRSHTMPDVAGFGKASHELDLWIDAEKPKLTSQREKAAMEQIDAAYDDYLRVARQLLARLAASGDASATMDEYEDLRKESQRLFALGRTLRDAHLALRADILAQANRSIGQAWTFQLVSLAGLFLLAVMLAALVYSHMILPLRARLIEGQALLERQEKLASLGLLAAGVAHEIRNPLTALKGAVFLQQKKFDAGSPEYADAKVVEREILRLERIVSDFLFFARPGDLQLAPTTADAPLRAVHALLAAQLAKNGVQLVLEEPPRLPVILDEARIEQVLINVVQNAADAVGRNGVVRLRASAGRRRIDNREKQVVILEVSDNGKGIPPEVRQRLFDPFFTTKENGTGLGLSIAAGIVQKHGGAIEYQTQIDYGTTFGIVLPANGE